MPSVIRVLQLLAKDADFESRQGARQLAQGLGPDFRTETVEIRNGGVSGILEAMRQLRERRGRFDLVHVWGEIGLTAAGLRWKGPIIYSLPPVLTRRSLGWLRAAMSHRDIQVVCAAGNQYRRCVRHGIAPERCRLIRPGVDFSRLVRRRDDGLRRRLRLEAEDFVLLLVGESTRSTGHLEGIWTAGILHVMDPRYKVVLWGCGPMADSLRRHGLRMGAAAALRFATDELGSDCDPGQLLAVADMVLVPAQGAISTLPVAWAMGAGLPIIATASPVVSELLEDHHTALMTTRAIPRQIARRILELRDDSALQWSVADRARAEAYDYFSQSRFVQECRQVYRDSLS